MQTEPLISSNRETPFHNGNGLQQDKDPAIASSSLDPGALQLPAKKPRQWAAWTRQEEESFFAALRQVGKNFEKITSRVQSKNKDQVRHYYYRLVRRMNKLLVPELSLDAKNPKDTNAAMLRWWSLLEKYSCKASKLHLKPRRFKIFVEALEHQLLKDRKKNIKKRASQGENFSSIPCSLSTQSREKLPDNSLVKMVVVDSQNFKKLGSATAKGAKRNSNTGMQNGSSKGEAAAAKGAKQQRKPAAAAASSTAYKKWEKAAMAGVSLVADAAEHLERTMIDKDFYDQGQKGECILEKSPLHSSAATQNTTSEGNSLSSVKLKLQLFPIDDDTRRALEMDKHNPYLELTLSNRKKISSVLEHLVRKWGNSSAASGELMLFPYGAQKENLVSCQRWTQDSFVSAANVHAMVGNPQVFRLRYGWYKKSARAHLVEEPSTLSSIPVELDLVTENQSMQAGRPVSTLAVEHSDKPDNCSTSVAATSVKCQRTTSVIGLPEPKLNPEPTSVSGGRVMSNTREDSERDSARQMDDLDGSHFNNDVALSVGAWADTLTNVSVGDLLSEVPDDANVESVSSRVPEGAQLFQQTPFSCDSFDAAIAAHILKHQRKAPEFPSTSNMPLSSIWDAEETCDGFTFRKNPVSDAPRSSSALTSTGHGEEMEKANSLNANNVEEAVEVSDDGDPMDECPSDPEAMDASAKNFNTLTDLYWPESLGPLDVEIPSMKYHSDDMIFCDSLGGLSRLLASSLDAFQNCSLLGFDQQPQASNG